MFNMNSEGYYQPIQQVPQSPSPADWQAVLGINQTTPGRGQFNPDQFQSASDITSAWYAAGRPQQDMYGRDLDVRGMPITFNGRQMSAPQQTQQTWGQPQGPQFGPVARPQTPMQQPMQQPMQFQNPGYQQFPMFNQRPQVGMSQGFGGKGGMGQPSYGRNGK